MLSRYFIYLYLLVFRIKSVRRIKGRQYLLTIDDFPKSSVNGLPFRFRYKTTYFISGGLLDTILYGCRMFNASDLNEINEAGCHTYDHICCRASSSHQIDESLLKNQKFFENHGIKKPISFAFPKGRFNFWSWRRIVFGGYKVIRTTRPRQHRFLFSPYLLNGIPLYEQNVSWILDKIESEYQKNSILLSFYTHDIVSENPSKFGITEASLLRVLERLENLEFTQGSIESIV